MDLTSESSRHPASSADDVGYGKPPAGTRFKKGLSGNPKGRPKGSLNVASVFTKALRERVVINEHGKRKTVTKLEAALKQLVNKAASGEIRALRQLLDLAKDAEAKQNASSETVPMIDELDQQVVEAIMKRFHPEQETEEEKDSENTQLMPEACDVEDQRG